MYYFQLPNGQTVLRICVFFFNRLEAYLLLLPKSMHFYLVGCFTSSSFFDLSLDLIIFLYRSDLLKHPNVLKYCIGLLYWIIFRTLRKLYMIIFRTVQLK